MFTRNVFLISILLTLAACGGQQEKSVGLEEGVMLLLKSEALVGSEIMVDDKRVLIVTKDDLYTGVTKVWGTKKREDNKLQKVAIELTPGSHTVSVLSDGVPIYSSELYFSAGQTREIRIRK